MPTLTVKNIPQELYERLKQSAVENRRSINSEILVALERALQSGRVDPQALLARADVLRARAGLSPVTDELLDESRAHMARPTVDAAVAAAEPDAPEAGAGEPDAPELDAAGERPERGR